MEEKIKNNWNRNAIYSATCLILVPIIFAVLVPFSFWLIPFGQSFDSFWSRASRFLTGTNIFLVYDIGLLVLYLAYILAVISLVLSAYFGIRSIITNKGQERGRMLAIVSTTISVFVVVIAPILAFLF